MSESMNVAEIVKWLEKKGFYLSVDCHNRLEIKGRAQQFTPNLIARIKAHESELATWVLANESTTIRSMKEVCRGAQEMMDKNSECIVMDGEFRRAEAAKIANRSNQERRSAKQG